MTVQDRHPRTDPRRADAGAAASGERLRARITRSGIKKLVAAAAAGFLAALVAWFVVAVPVLVAWLADSLSTVSAWQALGFAASAWALAHAGVVDTTEMTVQITPLLATLIPVLLCRYAAGQVLTDDDSARKPAKIGGVRAAWEGVRAPELAVFIVGYVAMGVAICIGSGLGSAPASPWLALPGLIMVPVVGIALDLLREHRREQNPTIARALRWLAGRVPVLARRGLKPAGEALSALGVTALLGLVALLVMRAERVGGLYAALDAGIAGAAVLTIGQVLFLPNMIMWVLGWMVGAGFTVGTVHVGWEASTAGQLPLVPVLAALPEPGSLPGWFSAVGFVPLIIGGWLGYRSATVAPRLASWWTKAQVALASCAWVSVTILVLSWLAVGSLTPGLLGTIGTAPLVATGLLSAELLMGAAVVVTGLHVRRRTL
ncbi:MAG: DUF6350 family protein [Ornithinimicrobium sp.]